MFNIKNHLIYTLILMIISLMSVILITLYGHSNLDVSSVQVENIDILGVFYHNFVTVFSSTFLGIFTAGIYSLFVLVINIINVGTLTNALYINNMSSLIPKLIPHGIIELLSLCFCVVYSCVIFVSFIKNIKLVFLKKCDVKILLKKLFVSFISFMLLNIILLGIAAVIEYIV